MRDTAAMETSSAIKNMWSIADKPERLRCFHKIVFELGLNDPHIFWDQFWSIWTTSENLNEEEDFIRPLIEHGCELGSSLLGLEDSERAAITAMEDQITVYRGGNHWNLLGWSWTTNREKARWFAERAHGPKERIVATAVIDKSKVLAFLTGRGESEIVINPLDIGNHEIIEEFEGENGKSSGLFYAIQSGKLAFGQDSLRAEMLTSHIRYDDIENNIAEISQMLEFAVWADLSKGRFFRECINALQARKIAGPTPEPSTFSL